MEENTTRQLLIEIQDYLAPKLDSYEQMLYHYLFRHTHLEGKSSITIGIRTAQARVGLGVGLAGSPPSQNVVMKKLRSLQKKGCIKVLSRSSKGTEIKVFLPKEIPGLVPKSISFVETPIEELDFFNTPELRLTILKREGMRCFYCLRKLSEDNYTIDHVTAQATRGTHSYKNVVACCFECNIRKQDKEARSFLLRNYREGLLTTEEYKERLGTLEAIVQGNLRPDVSSDV